jgi:tetratricopeptide (TPR) repeat protein
MKRVLAAGGVLGIFLVIGAVGFSADPKQRQVNQPAASTNSSSATRQADAVRAAQAAQAAKVSGAFGGAPTTVRPIGSPAIPPQAGFVPPPAIQPVTPVRDRPPFNYGYYPYRGYGYGYPYGTTPYTLGYDPYSGQAYLYPGGYYGYSPYGYGYGNGYPYYGRYLGYGYPGAVFINPGQLFGIGPIQQLMGVNPGGNQQPGAGGFGNFNQNIAANGNNGNPGFVGGNGNGGNQNVGNQQGANQQNGNAAANVPAPPKPGKAAVGTKANELAWKFITFGDARFGALKYNEALDRYRRAAKEAPTLAEAWFRQGFAQAAMGKYDQAAKSMRRGLQEKPDWADAGFRLDEVYGNNAADKKALVDGMVKAAEDAPNDGDLALVVGIHLYCDGKSDQAASFFRRAGLIQGNDKNIKGFLPK